VATGSSRVHLNCPAPLAAPELSSRASCDALEKLVALDGPILIVSRTLMPVESGTRSFDIGYILFIDIVGYSKLRGEEQTTLLRKLIDIVRGTPEFRRAEMAGQLVRLPAGDGMALVFFASPEAPVQCALEISRALKGYPRLQVRMGVNSGPIDRVEDVNDRVNVSGAGINMAQRVMSCGDANHILLGKHIADDLAQYEKWRPHLCELGKVQVKHGVKIDIVNFCFDGIGNRELPAKIKQDRRQEQLVRQKRLLLAGAFLLMALLIAWGTYQHLRKREGALGTIPDKSIAVLPFENRSDEKQNAFFADGVQDEILTDLSRIADLKVISRTSTMLYKSDHARNLREIAHQLGVAYLLEGSVQRAGGKVRINAQLIDARNDAHLWAQTYDRDLADVFAIQSEIAETIARQLQARLSSREKTEIERPPTTDNVAFDLYTQAKTLLTRASFVGAEKTDLLQAVELLKQAVARDPKFLLAYCQLANAHGQLYFFSHDRTPARAALADSAIQKAAALRPDAGETHLARAGYFYRCFKDYDRARTEVAIAAPSLPNSSELFALLAAIDRRQGRWEDSSRNFEKAFRCDPRNFGLLQQMAATYDFLRRYADEAATFDRALELAPDNLETRIIRGFVEVQWKGDLRLYREAIHAVLSKDPKNAADVSSDWFQLAFFERDAVEASRALAAIPAEGIKVNAISFPRAWYEGWNARLRNDEAAAQNAFARARTEAALAVEQHPDFGPSMSVLGAIDAVLGHKEEAVTEGRRSVELLPLEKDYVNGANLATWLAIIYGMVGEKNLAIEQLKVNFSKPGDGSYGDMRVDPYWDPLRGDPRFEKLVASLAPKD
jgi:TolB-like protein/class 3 adenylate cyclase/Tfp pilus assembly protein PilF